MKHTLTAFVCKEGETDSKKDMVERRSHILNAKMKQVSGVAVNPEGRRVNITKAI